jgi:type III pantothenate kinase
LILCLDAGNSHLVGGVFEAEALLLQFRRSSQGQPTSDEMGVFLRTALRENGIEPQRIDAIALCSVVPDLVHSLRNGCLKYFGKEPFVLQAGVKTGLKIRYRDAREVGADRIADAIAALHQFPNQNLIVINFGTATAIEAISRDKEYLGGAILPGVRLSMEALETRTARLPAVEIIQPEDVVGRSTTQCIQSGLYFGTLGAVRLFIAQITRDTFRGEGPTVVATGGFSSLYRDEVDFHHVLPDLTLQGVRLAFELNASATVVRQQRAAP